MFLFIIYFLKITYKCAGFEVSLFEVSVLINSSDSQVTYITHPTKFNLLGKENSQINFAKFCQYILRDKRSDKLVFLMATRLILIS